VTRYSPDGEDSRALRLTSKLVDLRAANANLQLLQGNNQDELEYLDQKTNREAKPLGSFFGRGDKIRTCDFYVPNKYAIVF